MTLKNDKIDIIDAGRVFFSFCEQNNFGKWTNDWFQKVTYFELTKYEFHCLGELNMVFDGTNGGLVLGRLHSEGGVHLIRPILNGLAYEYVGEMEGWEYLSAPIINPKIGDKFCKINASTHGFASSFPTDFIIPSGCKVIDTLNISPAIIVLSQGRQAIINRNATKKHIRRIIRIEKQ